MTSDGLMCLYCTVIRPIIEYASPVWHSSLTMAQSDVLESLQKRAMNVILPGVDYTTALIIAGIDTLSDRRKKLTRRFFTRHVLDETSCLHYLLPPKRDDNITARLRKTTLFQNYRAKQTDSITHSYPTASEIMCNSFFILRF